VQCFAKNIKVFLFIFLLIVGIRDAGQHLESFQKVPDQQWCK
jgi:hypothetical protein